MSEQMLILLTLLHLVVAAPRPASPQLIQAVEGENAAVWCRFNRPENFTPKALHWTVNDTKAVLFSRHKGWIDPHAADAQYENRTSVSLEDLARGILLVNISNVSPSDSGNYEGVVIGKLAGHDDTLELKCSVEVIVAAEKRNHVWKAVLGVLIPVAAVAIVVAVVWILVERGVIRICKKEGEPKTSEGDQ
ncbi:Polymeric immunoglobulin receptor [Dissostichus eleginoides]|nr:Polymeric immunoglobulin receptor [Dissostichus eleginoides]